MKAVEALRKAGIHIEHSYANVNGVRLHYVTAGSGKLILFVHGFPEFWYAWKSQLAEFGRDHQAVAVDMRGYNLSSKPAEVEQYRVRPLVQDLLTLAAYLGHSRFVLVGHDWGGVVAWALAAAHAKAVEKLVIINAPHPAVFERELRDNPAQQAASQYMLMFRSQGAEELLSENSYQRLIAGVLQSRLTAGHYTEADRDAYISAWSQPGALTGGLNYYRAARVGPPSSDPKLASESLSWSTPAVTVQVPTLVIWGERDTALLTANLDGLERFVPDLTIRRIPDGSHWVVNEKPALVNAHIRAFIEDRPLSNG